jgi:hypothetical protein
MNTTGQKKIVVTPNKVLVTGAGLLGKLLHIAL